MPKREDTEAKQFLDVGFDVKVDAESDEGYLRFEGYASTFDNVDHGFDAVMPGAFRDTIVEHRGNAKRIPDLPNERAVLKVFWHHDMSDQIGVLTDMDEDEKGLFVKGVLPKSDTLVAGRVMPQMKIGGVSDMSIGYRPTKIGWEERDGVDVRLLEKVTLFEVSLVAVPMNAEAHVTGFKARLAGERLDLAACDTPFDYAQAVKRVGDADGCPYLFKAEDGFDDAELFLIADVVDGQLKIVPRAVQRAAVNLALHKDTIGEAAFVQGRRRLNEIYKAAGRGPIFKAGANLPRLDDLDVLSQKEFEQFLRAAGIVSSKKATAITSRLGDLLRDADGLPPRDGDDTADDLAQLKKTLAGINASLKRES